MARAKNQGNGRLEEVMANFAQAQTSLVQAHASLHQSQASLVQTQAAFVARAAEMDAQIAELRRSNDERFARIEAIPLEHSRI